MYSAVCNIGRVGESECLGEAVRSVGCDVRCGSERATIALTYDIAARGDARQGYILVSYSRSLGLRKDA